MWGLSTDFKSFIFDKEIGAKKFLSTSNFLMFQLRYLQTLSTISAEKNSTIIFPLPLDICTPFLRGNQELAALATQALQATSSASSKQATLKA